MSEAWEALVERYKGNRPVCNCRQAYSYVNEDNMAACRYGCQANQYATKEMIAASVVEELQRLGVMVPVKQVVFVPYPGQPITGSP